MKITVEQLRNYLGTGLMVEESETIIRELVGIHNDQPILHDYGYTIVKNIQPIVYRLSDLDKEIDHNGERFVPITELAKLITQTGWQGVIQNVYLENNTFTVCFEAALNPFTDEFHQPCFEIDIDEDFGFGIYTKKWPKGYPLHWYEEESTTGNMWAMYQKLFEWHFWPFGHEYFEHGLVIDKRKTTS